MGKTGRRCTRADQGVDGASRARLRARGVPRLGELISIFCQFVVELERGGDSQLRDSYTNASRSVVL
jgi:hypothetical protein